MTEHLNPLPVGEVTTAPNGGISAGLTLLMAFSCGLIVAGIYLAQPLIQIIAPEIGLAPWAASLIVTATQLGYCVGLILLVPLGDLVENRMLVLCTLCAIIVALAAEALSPNGTIFILSSIALGVTAVVTQMLIPLAVHMARPEERGRTVGNILGGLLLGILLARPIASSVTAWLGWRTLFAGDAVVIVALTILLAIALPRRQPSGKQTYRQLIGSLAGIYRSSAELRRRAFGQAMLFGCFSLFWTAVPLELASRYGLTQSGIALFALAGAGGALAAPIVGRLADRGYERWIIPVAVLGVIISFAVTGVTGQLWILVVAAVVLDAGVQCNHTIAQRTVLALRPDAASRFNSLYIATFFLGGAIGSAIAAPLFLIGWTAVAAAGVVMALCALAIWIFFPRKP